MNFRPNPGTFLTILALLLLISDTSFSQVGRSSSITETKTGNNGQIHIDWMPVKTEEPAPGLKEKFLAFEGAIYDADRDYLPVFTQRKPLPFNAADIEAELINPVYEKVSIAEDIKGVDFITKNIEVKAAVSWEKKKPYSVVSLVPIRVNPGTGQYERLVSFDIRIRPVSEAAAPKAANNYAANSVLASGNWFKIGVKKSGIFRITYDMLQNLGMDPASIDPRNLRVYGNGGGMLPHANSKFRHDDLVENAIYVSGEEDGSFDQGDFILFYGENPHQWEYSQLSDKFEHQVHLYSDYTHYFLTPDLGTGKRIGNQASSDQPVTHTVNQFQDYAFHEAEQTNLIKSGRQWFGEHYDIELTHNYSFSFPNLILDSTINLETAVVGRYIGSSNQYGSNFNVKVNGTQMQNIPIENISGNYNASYAERSVKASEINVASPNLTVSITYNRPGNPNAEGWLDYLRLNVYRYLSMSGNEMSFRYQPSVGVGNVTEFNMSNASSNVKIWEVTDPTNVRSQQYSLSGSSLSFKVATDSLREFIAFTGSSYNAPELFGSVSNQNLHAMSDVDMVILCHPNFLSEANRLASFHRNSEVNPLSVEIVEPQEVYNEFSSGAADVIAIRSLMKMLYDRASTAEELPRYLLLFGDGSYDNKNRVAENTNFILTYESHESLSPTTSYASDDFYGFLDNNEGNWTETSTDALDIGIGRFPVQTLEEARAVVDKILHYEGVGGIGTGQVCSAGDINISSPDWRNIICFVGDDEDGNIHLNQAESLATKVDTLQNDYNIDKIYFDAYQQVSTPGGQRFPDATEALNNRVQKGALIINYTGHGGEVGWAHERVLQVSDINAWTNLDNLPAFMTATCEFSRYDDPGRTSAGELVLLNPNGGGIALFTTTRLVYSSPNFTLNKKFYDNVFPTSSGEIPTMGDVMRHTKNGTQGSGINTNSRNFSLLGDPAQRLAYPVNHVVTTSINNNTITQVPDTMKALALVSVGGEIRDRDGQKMTGFNGVLYPTVYDKASTITTLGNDPSSNITNFELQKNILYKGKVSVTNGEFSFSFVVPKDISYSYGPGRISYYAQNETTDANGAFEDFIIGGSAEDVAEDETGPEVQLYMNDESFVFGGTTNENPLLLAFVSDSNGINTVGNGIGHDITATLDESTSKVFVLNEYYEADMDSYQSGTIQYPFSELTPGRHTLRLKVWDVYNNSSEAYTEFIVAESAELALEHVLNYPNPFTTRTEFHFEHNHPCSSLDVNIQIFTISGKVVKTINEVVHTEGFRANPIQWDGRDEYGKKIGRGVYIYKIKVRTPEGAIADATEKLVILN